MNTRIKEGCADLFMTLANAFHRTPYSVLPFALSSFQDKRKTMGPEHVHHRFIKTRLDVLVRCWNEFGIDFPTSEQGHHPKGLKGLNVNASSNLKING